MRHNFRNPFKDKDILLRDINYFLSTYRTTITNNTTKISSLFEMGCYNSVVRFYEKNNYLVEVRNIPNGEFRYKLTSLGYPGKFSYFYISKEYTSRKGKKSVYDFEVRHNIPIASFHNKETFFTPDVSIIKTNSLKETPNPKYYYKGMRKFFYIENKDLVSFMEAKHYTPFTELLVSFIGVVNEIMPSMLREERPVGRRPYHLAPSLMISGRGNYNTRLIREDLINRYCINIFFSLFYSESQVYSKKHQNHINKIGTIV